MKLRSEHLVYREFSKEDFDLFYSIFSNGQVMRYAWRDEYNSKEECMGLFHSTIGTNEEGYKNVYPFAVFLEADNRFIGYADIEINYKNSLGGCGEIGYFLLPEFWGCGYATEIAKTLIDFGFEQIKLHRIEARCNANNLLSEKVMRKAGMMKEAELRKVRFKNSQWDNEKLYSILKEEWINKGYIMVES